MHIVILADPVDNQKAGIHTYTKNLIENLLKIDNKNRYTFIHKKKNPFFKGKRNRIVPRYKFPGAESLRKHITLPRLIKKLKADIVLEPCHIGPFNLPKSIKRAVTIHDLTPILFPNFHPLKSKIIHRLFLKNTIKNADIIFTPSKNTKQDIENNFKTKAKIIVTPLGIDRPHRGIKKNPYSHPYFLYLGTIEPRKNLELLIDTFLELKEEENLPHKLVLAGEIGWKARGIKKKAKKSKDIIMAGHLSEEDKATHYKYADIFIYPSFYEGFGLPPLEAMSYKTPVICSTGGSLQEIFHENAVTFDPNDKEGLLLSILEILKTPNLRETLVKNGQTFSKKFTWEACAKKTLKGIEKACYS